MMTAAPPAAGVWTWQGQSSGILRDRIEAGEMLAAQLDAYRDDPTALILALPRGGVEVGAAISRELHVPLDVFISRKLRAPENQEYAIGAVTESGSIYLNPEALRAMGGFSPCSNFFKEMIAHERAEITRRQQLYRRGRSLPPLGDRTVILVDDGIATGATFLAAVEALRNLQVRRLVAAVPVGPAETLNEIAKSVDKLVVLMMPDDFRAVGQHYVNFQQVQDEQVVQYLTEADAAIKRGRVLPGRRHAEGRS